MEMSQGHAGPLTQRDSEIPTRERGRYREPNRVRTWMNAKNDIFAAQMMAMMRREPRSVSKNNSDSVGIPGLLYELVIGKVMG